jgi:hypothetical protein
MDTMVIARDESRMMAGTWVRSLAWLAAALGLAGTLLVGSGIVADPQPASARVVEEIDLDRTP